MAAVATKEEMNLKPILIWIDSELHKRLTTGCFDCEEDFTQACFKLLSVIDEAKTALILKCTAIYNTANANQ